MAVMVEKKKQHGKPPRARKGKSLNVYLSSDLREALDEYISGVRPKTTATAVAEMAIEEFLIRQNAWPPQPCD